MVNLTDNVTDEDLSIMARTIYGEARGEYNRLQGGLAALIAVANVIMNRMQQKIWYGQTIQQVCLKPYQFSCWNANDVNRTQLLTTDVRHDKILQKCYEVAAKVAHQHWPDLTGGSDHYYAVWLPSAPLWSIGKQPIIKIGHHTFYNLNGVL